MKPSERLQSLDALRGFDMLFIMGFASLVVAVCGLWPNAVTDSIASQMGHASWDGFTHHDTIFPLFLFIAGVSFPFSLSKQRSLGLSTGTIYAKIVRRALTLVLLGVIYNGLFRLDFENLRIASVLGRIGLAWGIAAVLYLNFGVKARIAIAAAILVGYGLLSALVAAPDVAGAGPLTREGCLAGYVDRLLLPGKLYGKTFDPEGLLSTVPAVVTAMLGMFTGEFVRRQDLSGGRKASWMIAAAVALLVASRDRREPRVAGRHHPAERRRTGMKRKLLMLTALALCLALLCGCTTIATSEWMQNLFPVGDEAVAAHRVDDDVHNVPSRLTLMIFCALLNNQSINLLHPDTTSHFISHPSTSIS